MREKTGQTEPSKQTIGEPGVRAEELEQLAAFRALLREFESWSEHASAALGLTSVQYQALLAIKTRPRGTPLTLKALAGLLLIKHNSAVGLVDRIAQLGLVLRRRCDDDGRSVIIELTPRGTLLLKRLARRHQRELQRRAPVMGRYLRHFSNKVTKALPTQRIRAVTAPARPLLSAATGDAPLRARQRVLSAEAAVPGPLSGRPRLQRGATPF